MIQPIIVDQNIEDSDFFNLKVLEQKENELKKAKSKSKSKKKQQSVVNEEAK